MSECASANRNSGSLKLFWIGVDPPEMALCLAIQEIGSKRCGDPMVDSKQNRLAKQVVELSIAFKMALSNKRKYPMAEFKSFVAAAKRYVEALGRTHSFIGKWSVRSADFGSFLRLNANKCQGKFFTRLIDWNVSFLLAMIHTSSGTSRQAFSVKPILLKPPLRETDKPANEA